MKKAIKFLTSGIVASAAFVATTASAAPITFTISGVFDGTVNGDSFANEYVTFQGVSDTNNKVKVPDFEGFYYPLSSLLAYHNTGVYDFGAGMLFAYRPFGAAGFTKPVVFDPAYGSVAALLIFSAPLSYDGATSVASMPVSSLIPFSSTFSGPNFTGGAITNATGLTFSISVSPVPEMQTWGLLMMGCGAVGYAMRRRARVNATVRFA